MTPSNVWLTMASSDESTIEARSFDLAARFPGRRGCGAASFPGESPACLVMRTSYRELRSGRPTGTALFTCRPRCGNHGSASYRYSISAPALEFDLRNAKGPIKFDDQDCEQTIFTNCC